jgi:hypothetical protein
MERIRPHVKVGSSHDAAVHPTLVSRAQRSTKWCAADPGPFQTATVPDQRCTAPLRYALHRIRDTQASDAFGALFTFQTAQIFSFPRRMSAPGVCNFASLTRIEGWAERRSATRTSSRRLRLPQATSRA